MEDGEMKCWGWGNGIGEWGWRNGDDRSRWGNGDGGIEIWELDRKMRIRDGDGGIGMEKGIGEIRMIEKC